MAQQAFNEYCETRKSSEDIRQCFSRDRIKEVRQDNAVIQLKVDLFTYRVFLREDQYNFE